MKSDRAPARPLSAREKVRALGFDPDHLTPAEQKELLEMNASLIPRGPDSGTLRMSMA